MGLDRAAPPATRVPMVLRMRSAGLKADSRRFWIGAAVMATLHAALIAGFVRSAPRYVGELEGSQEGISVELVDAADLASASTVRSAEPSIGQPGSAPPPPPPTPRDAAPQPEPKAAAAPPVEAERPSPPTPPAARESPPAPNKESTPAPPTKSKPAPSLDVSPPLRFDLPDGAFAPGGRSAAVMRPPNVTRSGENDEFGRGVIRALRKTMPVPRDALGRVTVRLLLSETGNLTQAQLVRSSGDPILDQNVVFAARQSSFPIPPAGATLADRTFLVTYIYR
jgi:protein TonB